MAVKSRTFVWHVNSPPEAIWPILGDTARLNEAAGFPKHVIDEQLQPDGTMRFMAEAQVGPLTLKWDDQPQNWVTGKWFRHNRFFENGPLKSVCAQLSLSPDGSGSRVEFIVEAESRNLIGKTVLATGFFPSAEKTYGKLVAEADAFAQGLSDDEFVMQEVKLADGVPERVRGLVAEIEETAYGHGLAQNLADYVTTRPEVDCSTIRPITLSRLWDVPQRLAIEVCLQAAKSGLLGSRWDLLCPRCQVGKEPVSSLGEMPTGTHCPSCNIDYERDFTKNLELAFSPSRSIRPIDNKEYCLFGPMSTPHIKAQITVPAGDTRDVEMELGPGSFRFRSLEAGPELVVDWDGGALPAIVANGVEVTLGEPAPEGLLRLVNHEARPLTFIVEEFTWKRDVLTAHQATTMQAFRELFDEDVLRAGDDVEIDNVTLMFTDFKGSTALYERIGDSQAYHLIRGFFQVLGGAIRENNGSIVKTIGDAVNAAFFYPLDALKCAIQIQADVEEFNATSGKEPITVTIGIHVGRCISVTLNDNLDYYGTAANKAARLEGESIGGDVVLSSEFYQDAAVQRLLEDYTPVEETADLKGFEGAVPFYRITAQELAAKRETAHD